MKTENKSKGLGDSISKITHVLKIDKVVDAITHLAGIEGCGCEERKEFLNQLFPYGKKRQFEVMENFEAWGVDYKKGDKIYISNLDQIYANVLGLVEQNKLKEL